MKSASVEVNELIQVGLVDSEHSRAYFSRIEDISDSKVTISWPTDGGVRIPFHVGESLFLSYTRQDAVYGFRASVLKTLPVPIPLIVLESVGPTQRIQRRDFVRVPALLPIEMIGTLGIPVNSQEDNIISIKTNTIDISGGGFCFQNKSALPIGILFKVKLNFPGKQPPLEVQAKVVRCQAREDANHNQIFRLGMMFISITESVRSRIVRYVFEVQTTLNR